MLSLKIPNTYTINFITPKKNPSDIRSVTESIKLCFTCALLAAAAVAATT